MLELLPIIAETEASVNASGMMYFPDEVKSEISPEISEEYDLRPSTRAKRYHAMLNAEFEANYFSDIELSDDSVVHIPKPPVPTVRKKSRGRPRKSGLTRAAKTKSARTPRVILKQEGDEISRISFIRRRTARRGFSNLGCKVPGNVGKQLPWTLAALTLHISSNESALLFCQEKGLLPRKKQCPVCREDMLYSEKLSSDKGLGYVFRCSRRACQIVRSARSGTWFEKSKLPIRKSLLLTYCFATNFPFNLAVHESSFTAGCTSPTTVSDWYSYCREVCVDAMKRQMEEKLGGPMCIVEMDEAKVGEKNVGRRSFEGQSVLGFYCRMSGKVSLVCLPSNERDASTLVPVIEEHVNPGSTIVVDCWNPEEMLGPGYHHLVHNCQFNFTTPECGLRNSGIDKIWRHLKALFPQTDNYKKAYQLNEYLCEFLWRRWVDFCMMDPFEAFLHDASLLYMLPEEEM